MRFLNVFVMSEEKEKTTIIDQTETNLISLRRTIYLTIQSSLDFEECAHKLMKMQLKPGQEVIMLIGNVFCYTIGTVYFYVVVKSCMYL